MSGVLVELTTSALVCLSSIWRSFLEQSHRSLIVDSDWLQVSFRLLFKAQVSYSWVRDCPSLNYFRLKSLVTHSEEYRNCFVFVSKFGLRGVREENLKAFELLRAFAKASGKIICLLENESSVKAFFIELSLIYYFASFRMLIKAGSSIFLKTLHESKRRLSSSPKSGSISVLIKSLARSARSTITGNDGRRCKRTIPRLRLIKIHSKLYLFSCLFNYYKQLQNLNYSTIFYGQNRLCLLSRMLCPFVCWSAMMDK